MEYVRWLNDKERNLQKKANNGQFRGTTWAELREDFECQWQFFVYEKNMITSVDVVPFPAGPPDNLFCLDSNMSFQDQMQHCKIMLLRYHPDKFFANFQSQIPADDGVLLQGLKKN